MAFGLGRGLEALIPNKKPTRSDPVQPAGMLEVAITQIKPNPHQPRKRFNVEKLDELAGSIREHGILEPLVVSPEGSGFILIAGERRLRAAELAGLKKVPVVVRPTDNQEKLELALIENIQRQDLNALDEAKALRKLVRDFNLNQAQVAKKVGRSRPAIANSLRLLELPAEIQRAVLEERISEGHARAILGAATQAQQIELLRQIEELHLSVRQTERLARQTAPKKKTERAPEPVDASLVEAARQLSSHLGARVQVISAPRGGRIVVEYYSTEERDRLVSKMLGRQDKLSSARDGQLEVPRSFSV
jgi:ParB family chromosome partitioning protein